MDRENFFVLLELSTDPPESDPEKIELAVKNLQAKWSRFRNHPTKSIQAKKILGLLPEMKTTEDLRSFVIAHQNDFHTVLAPE
ncbi:MAG: hypothetical protein QMD09_05865, partial [Desulfatibacillaceae bacterium]|nr:hypothetical protein [Desulfatibacillaceae bacterium]